MSNEQPRLTLSLKMPPRAVTENTETLPSQQENLPRTQTFSLKLPLRPNTSSTLSNSPQTAVEDENCDGDGEAEAKIEDINDNDSTLSRKLSLKLPLRPSSSSSSSSAAMEVSIKEEQGHGEGEEEIVQPQQTLSLKLPIKALANNQTTTMDDDNYSPMEIDEPYPEQSSQQLSLKLPFKSSTQSTVVNEQPPPVTQPLSLKLSMKSQAQNVPSSSSSSTKGEVGIGRTYSESQETLSQSVYKIEESDNTSEGDIIAATSRALYAVNELINILDGEEPEDPINTMCTAVNNYVRELKVCIQTQYHIMIRYAYFFLYSYSVELTDGTNYMLISIGVTRIRKCSVL